MINKKSKKSINGGGFLDWIKTLGKNKKVYPITQPTQPTQTTRRQPTQTTQTTRRQPKQTTQTTRRQPTQTTRRQTTIKRVSNSNNGNSGKNERNRLTKELSNQERENESNIRRMKAENTRFNSEQKTFESSFLIIQKMPEITIKDLQNKNTKYRGMMEKIDNQIKIIGDTHDLKEKTKEKYTNMEKQIIESKIQQFYRERKKLYDEIMRISKLIIVKAKAKAKAKN